MQKPAKSPVKPEKNRRKALAWTLGLTLALAAALVALLPSIRQWFPGKRYPDPVLFTRQQTLSSEDPAQLSTIRVEHAAGDSYTLEYQNGALLLRDGNVLLDINDVTSDQFLEAATVIAISDTVAKDGAEVEEHLSEMGLNPAQTTATVTYTDGRCYTLEIGTAVPDTTYFYYRWSQDPGVYMCDVGVSEVFALTANRLLPISQPVLAAALIDRVALKNQNGDMEISFSTDGAGFCSGSFLDPVQYPLSADSAKGVLTALENLRLGTLEGKITPENREEYGFTQPLAVVSVHQNQGAYTSVDGEGQLIARELGEQTLRFTFGRVEQEYFYTCEYEGNAYLVSRFLVETFIGGSPEKWMTRNPADLGQAELSTILIQTGSGELDVRIRRAERVLPNNQLETDAQGQTVYDTTVTLNGEEIPKEQLDALVERLKALAVSGDAPENFSWQEASPRWKLMLTTQGGTVRTIAAYRVDAFSDALVVDGVVKHTCYVEALLTALGELNDLLTP